jgi:transposase InsO family protein
MRHRVRRPVRCLELTPAVSSGHPRNPVYVRGEESFLATLKVELMAGVDWPTREAARAAVFEYVEVWYNRRRLHSALGYLTPMAYERMQAPKNSKAA